MFAGRAVIVYSVHILFSCLTVWPYWKWDFALDCGLFWPGDLSLQFRGSDHSPLTKRYSSSSPVSSLPPLSHSSHSFHHPLFPSDNNHFLLYLLTSFPATVYSSGSFLVLLLLPPFSAEVKKIVSERKRETETERRWQNWVSRARSNCISAVLHISLPLCLFRSM